MADNNIHYVHPAIPPAPSRDQANNACMPCSNTSMGHTNPVIVRRSSPVCLPCASGNQVGVLAPTIPIPAAPGATPAPTTDFDRLQQSLQRMETRMPLVTAASATEWRRHIAGRAEAMQTHVDRGEFDRAAEIMRGLQTDVNRFLADTDRMVGPNTLQIDRDGTIIVRGSGVYPTIRGSYDNRGQASYTPGQLVGSNSAWAQPIRLNGAAGSAQVTVNGLTFGLSNHGVRVADIAIPNPANRPPPAVTTGNTPPETVTPPPEPLATPRPTLEIAPIIAAFRAIPWRSLIPPASQTPQSGAPALLPPGMQATPVTGPEVPSRPAPPPELPTNPPPASLQPPPAADQSPEPPPMQPPPLQPPSMQGAGPVQQGLRPDAVPLPQGALAPPLIPGPFVAMPSFQHVESELCRLAEGVPMPIRFDINGGYIGNNPDAGGPAAQLFTTETRAYRAPAGGARQPDNLIGAVNHLAAPAVVPPHLQHPVLTGDVRGDHHILLWSRSTVNGPELHAVNLSDSPMLPFYRGLSAGTIVVNKPYILKDDTVFTMFGDGRILFEVTGRPPVVFNPALSAGISNQNLMNTITDHFGLPRRAADFEPPPGMRPPLPPANPDPIHPSTLPYQAPPPTSGSLTA